MGHARQWFVSGADVENYVLGVCRLGSIVDEDSATWWIRVGFGRDGDRVAVVALSKSVNASQGQEIGLVVDEVSQHVLSAGAHIHAWTKFALHGRDKQHHTRE